MVEQAALMAAAAVAALHFLSRKKVVTVVLAAHTAAVAARPATATILSRNILAPLVLVEPTAEQVVPLPRLAATESLSLIPF